MSEEAGGAIPAGWARASIADTGEYINGMAFRPADWSDQGLPIIRIQNLTDPSRRFNRTTREAPEQYLVRVGDILVSWSATLDAFTWNGPDALLNQHIFKVLPETRLVNRAFLFHLLRHHIQLMVKSEHLHGSTMTHINRKPFLGWAIAIPPLGEQSRIVLEIDKQMSRVEAAEASLERVEEQLIAYRASVLKAACEGRLVPTEAALARAEGREYEPAHALLNRIRALLGEPTTSEGASGLGRELPEGWALATLGSLASDSGYGTSVKCSYDGLGIPVLRIPNIVGGRIDLSDLKRSVQQDGAPSQPACLRPGDFLVVRTNGSRDLIGRAAVIESELGSAHYFASYLIRFRLVAEPMLWRWLSIVWQGVEVRQRLEGAAATSAGQYNLGEKVLAKIPIPIPPAAEQRQIIAEVERRLSIADELAASVDAALARAARLRQSILKRAFEGKLVLQDPSDEPASVLLERIRKEREVAAGERARQPRARVPGRRRAKASS